MKVGLRGGTGGGVGWRMDPLAVSQHDRVIPRQWDGWTESLREGERARERASDKDVRGHHGYSRPTSIFFTDIEFSQASSLRASRSITITLTFWLSEQPDRTSPLPASVRCLKPCRLPTAGLHPRPPRADAPPRPRTGMIRAHVLPHTGVPTKPLVTLPLTQALPLM